MTKKLYDGELETKIDKRIHKLKKEIKSDRKQLRFYKKQARQKEVLLFEPPFTHPLGTKELGKAEVENYKTVLKQNETKLKLLRAEKKALRSKKILRMRREIAKTKFKKKQLLFGSRKLGMTKTRIIPFTKYHRIFKKL